MRSARLIGVLVVIAAALLAGRHLAPPAASGGGSAGARPRHTQTAQVTKNTDGDTLRLSGIGRVRLIGVDTPEVYGRVECYGHEASAFTARVLPPGTRVRYRLGPEPRDRYGRALAYLWLTDGRFFNEMLVDQGYANVLTITPDVDYADRFRAAERRARRAERGLWSPSTCAG
jgi:micrococcal nuclease